MEPRKNKVYKIARAIKRYIYFLYIILYQYNACRIVIFIYFLKFQYSGNIMLAIICVQNYAWPVSTKAGKHS